MRHTRSRRATKYLAWMLALSIADALGTQKRDILSTYLRDNGHIARLLDEVAAHAPLESSMRPFDSSALSPQGILSVLHQFDVMSDQSFAHLASWLMLKTLEVFPTIARLWWQSCDRHVHNLVEKFSMRCLSPAIVQRELERVLENRSHDKYSNFDTQVLGNEVTASYEEDEVKLSIVLRLPTCYPLKAIDVGGDKRVGINDALWRRWLLSMATLLLTQDGTILDALLLWKNSLDRHFEGVDVCPICYSLFHPSSKQLPGMACKTCKNKFHSACLYKWFHTSHKSECPLCRSPFIA
eukprot:TRINITY_DN4609_c0_g1_i1.p1 TRINITY_DN4609_c0_g1~~TRINITY_DN4609_c0_g1_i1.p1  ORF type:complete len:296 (-),score=79.57 TRINITY_DN4609_c0_g1_i1:156-1043(-)